ncbi:MAG: toxic anion resistance protein [Candidatus Obscuribacterales bacterium]|jgi:hypothetical protein|nr:toxic anion resistance protein [Candidatus Obscuribacterales bacterium]
MVEGFRDSEKDAENNRPVNPFDESRDDDKKEVSRVAWGDGVAPAARNLPAIDSSMNGPDPNANPKDKPWRAGQTTAPITDRIVPVDPSLNGDPNQNRGADPWRAGYPESSYRGPGQTYENPSGRQPGVPAADDWKTQVGDRVKQQGMPTLPTVPMGGPTAEQLGLNGVDADKRKNIQDSLDLRTPYYGYLATGAFSGALSNSLVWGLDKKLASMPAETRTGFWKAWEARSPMMKEHMELARRVLTANENWMAADGARNLANANLEPHGKALAGLVKDINKQVKKGVKDEALGELLKRQQAFLGETKNLVPSRMLAQLGTAEEVAAGQKLFDMTGKQGTVLKEYAAAAEQNALAKSAVTSAESTLQDAHNKLTAATKEGPGPFSGKLMNGAAWGALVSGGTLAAGYGIDKVLGSQFGYETKTDAATRFLVDGVAIPSIILAGGQGRFKYAAAGGLFLSTRAYEFISGAGMFEGSVQMSAALRPTTADALLIPAAATIPIINAPGFLGMKAGGWQAMTAQVAAAWAIGRGYNALAYAMNWDGHRESGKEQAEMFSKAFNRDRVSHNIDSFNTAVDKGKTLGKENEAKLELEWTDWQKRDPGDSGDPKLKMSFWRGNATITAALGEFRLDEGSRLSIAGHVKGIAEAQHADKEERILKGHDLDFGGEALTWLRLAARDIIRMRNYARTHEGEVVDGVKMDAAYDQQLEKMQKRVESQIDKIYGEHKIEEIYDVMLEKTRKDVFAMDKALVKLVEEYEVLRSKDTKYLAKKARDIALGYLAESERATKSTNGMDADALGKTAWQYLQRAEQLDPENKDLPKLKKIAGRVVKNIQPAIDKQWENRGNNPFELRR